MEDLTKKQESFCENAGIFGVLISATCLIQHIVFMVPGWLTYSIIFVYLLSITGFTLLARRSAKAYLLILISTILIFLVEVLMIVELTFSLVLLIQLIYSVMMIVFMNIDGIQKQLKRKEMNEKAEKEKWNGLIN
jgi:hypothetical protein